MSKKIKMRVWHIPQVPGNPFYVNVDNVIEAKKVLDILAIYDQFQFQNNIKPDFCNTAGVQVYNEEQKEWEDFYDEDGNDFDQHYDEKEHEYGIENFCKDLIRENKIKF